MADKIVLIDTSILIDLFRKSDKSNSVLISLVKQGYSYCISAITEYEIFTGALLGQIDFWNQFLEKTQVLPFDGNAAELPLTLTNILKLSEN
jgi:tRNA(fMet)-specific endonuclease VapC